MSVFNKRNIITLKSEVAVPGATGLTSSEVWESEILDNSSLDQCHSLLYLRELTKSLAFSMVSPHIPPFVGKSN